MSDKLIRLSDALAAAQDASDNSDEPQDVVSAIAALPAVTVGVRYVFADGETIDEMRYKFLASKDGKDLYAQGDVKLAWVNEGDLYTAQFALAPVAAPDPAAIREAWEKAYWRMRSYALHDNDCKLNKPPHFNGPCSCGLTAALEEALALIQKGTTK